MIKACIVDDHTLFCEGIEKILTQSGYFQIVQRFSNGSGLLENIHACCADVLIMDIEMPGMNGLDVIKRVKLYNPAIKIAMLSMHEERAYVQEACLLGADAYLNKSIGSELLIQSLLRVCQGEQVFPKITLFDKQESPLSKREEEILKLIAKGKTSYTIAQHLRISQLTVKAHRRNMMRKLKANNASEMVTKAIEKGLI